MKEQCARVRISVAGNLFCCWLYNLRKDFLSATPQHPTSGFKLMVLELLASSTPLQLGPSRPADSACTPHLYDLMEAPKIDLDLMPSLFMARFYSFLQL
ncbi:hypothetical protein GOP47_0008060 [Adiantum capillus-veneris]|uniref:Uncharacterized protein n=1 Tax=Adiantum capillus-veneris TaxID=13818 RepID=A0A9D4UY78_ADICA|nr:hypothetical protein GOP47_0008060 [Adiantum capillus-veneris]